MVVAVSGPTRITLAQAAGVRAVLEAHVPADTTVVSGGAYGVDSTAAVWAKSEGLRLVLIVPNDLLWHQQLALIADDLIGVSGSYMDRNEAIAEHSHSLMAFPATRRAKLRSGTWATVRRFEARGKDVKITSLAQFR